MPKHTGWIRLAAYLMGLGGLALVVLGRSGGGSAAPAMRAAGAVLLVAMFMLFMVSYALYMTARFRRPARGPNRPNSSRFHN